MCIYRRNHIKRQISPLDQSGKLVVQDLKLSRFWLLIVFSWTISQVIYIENFSFWSYYSIAFLQTNCITCINYRFNFTFLQTLPFITSSQSKSIVSEFSFTYNVLDTPVTSRLLLLSFHRSQTELPPSSMETQKGVSVLLIVNKAGAHFSLPFANEGGRISNRGKLLSINFHLYNKNHLYNI